MYKLKNIATPRELLKTINEMPDKVQTELQFQYLVMPDPNDLPNRVIQFIGDDDGTYETGSFYKSMPIAGSEVYWWELVSGGIGGGEENGDNLELEEYDITIPFDEEEGMYLHMLGDMVLLYVAQGIIFDPEESFVESEGDAMIAIWTGEDNLALKEFYITFGSNSYHYDDEWFSMPEAGTYVLNLVDTTIASPPDDIMIGYSMVLSQSVPIEIDDVMGLREELDSKVRSDELDQMIYVSAYILDIDGEFEEVIISLNDLKSIGERGEFVTKAALDKRLTEIMNIINGI